MENLSLIVMAALMLLSACTTDAADGDPHQLGNTNAPVLLEEFSDPECPACGIISPQVEALVRENPELVRLEYYHFPLSYHENAFAATEAAECAGDQGKFFEFMGILFQNQHSLRDDFYKNTANSLELDRIAFDACLENETFKPKILAHLAEGKKRKLPGTPSLYVNGQLIQWTDPETFKAYLETLVK